MRVTLCCDQNIDAHFPAHFSEVYGHLLPEAGISTTIVAFRKSPSGGDGESKHYSVPRDTVLLRKFKGITGKLMTYLATWVSMCWMIYCKPSIRDSKIFLVHNDPFLWLPVWCWARLLGRGIGYRVTHLMPESLASSPGIRGVVGKIGMIARDRVLRCFDYVFPTSEAMGDYLYARAPKGLAGKIVPLEATISENVGWGSSPPDDGHLVAEEIRRKMRGCSTRFWMSYVGTIDPAREPRMLLDVLGSLREKTEDGALLLLAAPEQERYCLQLERYLEDRGLSPFVVIGTVHEQEVTRLLASTDVGLSVVPNELSVKFNSPLKMLEYMKSGVPIIASDIPDQRKVIEACSCGLVVKHEMAEYLKAVLLLHSESPEHRKRRGKCGKMWLKENRLTTNAAMTLVRTFQDW